MTEAERARIDDDVPRRAGKIGSRRSRRAARDGRCRRDASEGAREGPHIDQTTGKRRSMRVDEPSVALQERLVVACEVLELSVREPEDARRAGADEVAIMSDEQHRARIVL